jgi:hypothetical protein
MIKTLNGWLKMAEDIQDKPVWIFVNKDSGTLIEHTNLHGLLSELKQVHGLNLPTHVDVDLLINKRVDITVKDEDGDDVHIALGEHHPSRNIFFENTRHLQ